MDSKYKAKVNLEKQKARLTIHAFHTRNYNYFTEEHHKALNLVKRLLEEWEE